MDENVKVGKDQEETRSVKTVREVRQSEYLTKEALEWFGDLKMGQETRTVKYADDLVLLAKKKRCYGARLID
jgi:hypothetical protein